MSPNMEIPPCTERSDRNEGNRDGDEIYEGEGRRAEKVKMGSLCRKSAPDHWFICSSNFHSDPSLFLAQGWTLNMQC